ncbi:MAG TPA: hypothetical protein VFV41_17165 [Streptosporangiaceae bacterium]|nr:hypothetical protein [Streptosporangiaceae bacterium]
MQHVVAFSRSAVVLRHWFEIDLDDASMEHGCRVELRALAPSAHRGSESAAQLITADAPQWRADLFDRLTDRPGSYGVAHYHPEFEGNEPCGRTWDPRLSADPWSWLRDQFTSAGRGASASGWPLTPEDAGELSDMADLLVAQAQRFAPERCGSAAECFRLTRDTRSSVKLMVENLTRKDLLDTERTAAWLA